MAPASHRPAPPPPPRLALPAASGEHTALFLARIARAAPNAEWALQAMGDFDHTARDWGTLIPECKMYLSDIVRGIKVDPAERVAVMRKGGVIRVSDYAGGGAASVPAQLVMGLAWDVTRGVNIDLDASAILLDASLQQIDLVFFGKLGSSDGSIKHGGDEREGDEKVISCPLNPDCVVLVLTLSLSSSLSLALALALALSARETRRRPLAL